MANVGGGEGSNLEDRGEPRQYIEISSDSEDSRENDGPSNGRSSAVWSRHDAVDGNHERSQYLDRPSHTTEHVPLETEDEQTGALAPEAQGTGAEDDAAPTSREQAGEVENVDGGAAMTDDHHFPLTDPARADSLPPSQRPIDGTSETALATAAEETTGIEGRPRQRSTTNQDCSRSGEASHHAATTPSSSQQRRSSGAANVTIPSSVTRDVIDLTGDDVTSAPSPPSPSGMSGPQPSQTRRRSSVARQRASSFRRQSGGRSSPASSEIALPRWQPDAEVTFCPICRTQFSFFVRKHHCRKCGRVVCNACSPHRITIPYQYIVTPPEMPRLSAPRYTASIIGGEAGFADFSNVGGGERVRLCNPCVPDPNTTPPQPLASPSQMSPRGSHYRSQSNISGNLGSAAAAAAPQPPPSRFHGYFAAGPGPESYARHRSVTHSGQGIAGPSSSSSQTAYTSTQNRILAGTPPSYFPASGGSGYPGASQARYRSMLDVGSSSSSSAAQNRALPPPPQIAEEDECPICHRELPPRTLPNFEVLRESHITACITSHSIGGGGRTPTERQQQHEQGLPDDTSGSTPPPFATRRTGMFPYVATEKDCVDSAECTICLEEFEVGVQMARLECLCRFHRSCITAWFINHPGRCPVHQHDSFGY